MDTFLPKFFDQILLLIESELKWLGSILQHQAKEESEAAVSSFDMYTYTYIFTFFISKKKLTWTCSNAQAKIDVGAVYDHYVLVAGMIGYSLDNINSKSFEQKLQAIAIGDSADHDESLLDKLITMHSSVAVFAQNAAQLLKSLKAGDQ